MIRAFQAQDLDEILGIWLDSNVKAHSFISSAYWEAQAPTVRELLPQAELLVYEDGAGELLGFLGLTGGYIAGLFVREDARSHSIGRRLLDQAKALRPRLELHVYLKNDRAARFYRREGFQAREERTDPHTGEEELRMVWEKGEPA